MQINLSEKLAKRRVVGGLAAVVFTCFAISGGVAQTNPGADATSPKMPYWSQWTDRSGQTHTTRCFVSGLKSEAFSSTPQFVRRLPGAVDSVVFSVLPVGWVGNWHANPKPQWAIVLSGEYYMETSDGTSATLKAGDVFFGGDQGASGSKAEPNKIGHLSSVRGNEPSSHIIVQLKSDPKIDRIGVACPY
ncbi:MAG: hypothetical protein P4L90_28630 [Rhodopila sp.]|nr:hypothetical protein [Rhodopila sp.]